MPGIKKRMKEDSGLYLKTLWNELRHIGYPGGYSTLSVHCLFTLGL